MSKILNDPSITSAEVNEDKCHKMQSFKTADCTVKLYMTTKKILIQGPGSSDLTRGLSEYLDGRDDEEAEEETKNNGVEASEIIATDQNVWPSFSFSVSDTPANDKMYCDCASVNSDLVSIVQELNKMKDKISSLSKIGGKITQPEQPTSDDSNMNIKLREENSCLRGEISKLKAAIKEQKVTIATLESEKAILITSIRILQQNPIPNLFHFLS